MPGAAPPPPLRALVTGATGFVGHALAQALRAAGWSVHALVRPTSAPGRVAALRDAGCTLHPHDGTLVALQAIVAAARPDCTWHLATRFVGDHRPDDVLPLVQDNVAFGALLLEALSALDTPAVVTVGSAWQQHANAAYSPVSLYAATKQAFDALAAYYAEVRGFRVVECLLTDSYGPGDPRRKLLWALGEAARTGTPLDMTDGTQVIDLLHVDDAVRALVIAGARARDGEAGTSERWAVRPGRPLTLRALVECYARVRGTPVPVHWGAHPARPRETRAPWTAGALLPGWTPTVTLDEGLAALP